MPSLNFFTDPLYWVAALAALAASIVRGFSGFGTGLIFMPIAAAALGPKMAVGILLIVDGIPVLPLVWNALKRISWSELAPLIIGAVVMAPIGVFVLIVSDPTILRWALSLMILIFVVMLAAGWAYRGPSRSWLSLLAGGLSGFLSGSVGVPGPPVLIYWLGRGVVSVTMRANAMVFFFFTSILSGTGYVVGGLITPDVIARSAGILPIYAFGLYLGSRMFGLASEETYRRIAYTLIVLAALVSMPIFG